MEYHDHEQLTPEEVLAEIASILALGYMRHVKTRSQGLDGSEPSGDVGDGENTAALGEGADKVSVEFTVASRNTRVRTSSAASSPRS